MSASNYQQLVSLIITEDLSSLQRQLEPLYQDLGQALREARPGRKSQEQVSFAFERLRLGVGILLMQLLTDLGGDEDSLQVRTLLEDALQASTVGEIDETIQQKSQLFEDLYTDLYVNAEAEIVLSLFEETLHATSQEEADNAILGALELTQDLELNPEDDQPEED